MAKDGEASTRIYPKSVLQWFCVREACFGGMKDHSLSGVFCEWDRLLEYYEFEINAISFVLFSVWWLRECACSIQKCIYYLTIHPNEEEKHISSHQLIKHGKSQINTTSNSFLSKQNRNHLQIPHLTAACVSIAFNPFSSFSDADSSSSWSFGATTTLLSFHLAILFLSLSQIGFHCPARRAIANNEMSRHDPYSCFYRAGKQGIIVFWGEKSL